MSRREQVLPALAVISFGTLIGLAFQLYKFDVRGDGFINVRLPLAIVIGILQFSAFHSINMFLLKHIAGNADRAVQLEDLKSYLPLLLVPVFPLQKKLFESFWPKPIFHYFILFFLCMMIVLKAITWIRLWKKRNERGTRPASLANIVLPVAAFSLGLLLFWFHQLTFVLDDFFKDLTYTDVSGRYAQQDDVTRKVLPAVRKASFSTQLLDGRMPVAVIGYKLLARPKASPGAQIPIRLDISAVDDAGKLLARRRHHLDAAKEEHSVWRDYRLDLPAAKRRRIHFRMRASPEIGGMNFKYLLQFLLHAPMDFDFFRDNAIRFVWSEPDLFYPDKDKCNVILISLDTLRADMLGCYGYTKNVSPAIDAFARESLMFKNTFSQSTWTLPSHLSLLTSRYPNEFGKYQFNEDIFAPQVMKPMLSGGNLRTIEMGTLAEILKENGYYCAAFTDGIYVAAYYGFYQGFHLYNEKFDYDDNSFRFAKEWMRSNRDNTFFVFLHTYLVHEYGRWFKSVSEVSSLPFIPELFPGRTDFQTLFSRATNEGRENLYAVSVRKIDAQIQGLIDFLKTENLYDNSIVIITSDHGESFGEVHNDGKATARGHAGTAYESRIRVPLLIKLAKDAPFGPKVIDQPVRLLDIAPTILDLAGLEPASHFLGRSIIPDGSPEQKSPPVFAAFGLGASGCIRDSQKKYIYHKEGFEEFYNLAADPAEMENLMHLKSPDMTAFREKYLNHLNEFGESKLTVEETAANAPPELRENLKALGYIN